MTELRPFILRMIIFLVIVLGICALLFITLVDAFLANPALNGVILGVLIIGIVFAFRQVLRLGPETAWLRTVRTGQVGLSVQRKPRLLAPIATMLADRRGGFRCPPSPCGVCSTAWARAWTNRANLPAI